MSFTIRCQFAAADCHDAVCQMDDHYGAAFVRIAERELRLDRIGTLAISLSIMHPAAHVSRPAGHGSYDKAGDTYYISQPLDYADWITLDWSRRTVGYASAVKAAVTRIAKSRITEIERNTLLDIADRAVAEVVSKPPEKVIPLMPIHLVYCGDNPVPGISFGGVQGLGTFHPPGTTYVEVLPENAFKAAESIPSREPALPSLDRIYCRLGTELRFYEAFPHDGQVAEHWGVAGIGGDNRFHAYATLAEATAIVARLKKEKYAEGFRPVSPSKHARLIIEYPVSENFADTSELDFRHEAEDFLHDLLGRLGLGRCDGGSSGQGTMEICNFVVDFNLAEAAIRRELAGTPFAKYCRIYLER